MARTCEQPACWGFRGDEVGGGRRNVWPFLGYESQIMLCCHQECQSWVISSTGPGSSLSNTPCVGFASSPVWLSKLPPSVHLPRPPATTSLSLGQLRVDPRLASFHVVVGRLSRNANGSPFQGVRLSSCSEMFSFEQLETKENHRFPFLSDPSWDPDRPEDSDGWERHPPD